MFPVPLIYLISLGKITNRAPHLLLLCKSHYSPWTCSHFSFCSSQPGHLIISIIWSWVFSIPAMSHVRWGKHKYILREDTTMIFGGTSQYFQFFILFFSHLNVRNFFSPWKFLLHTHCAVLGSFIDLKELQFTTENILKKPSAGTNLLKA